MHFDLCYLKNDYFQFFLNVTPNVIRLFPPVRIKRKERGDEASTTFCLIAGEVDRKEQTEHIQPQGMYTYITVCRYEEDLALNRSFVMQHFAHGDAINKQQLQYNPCILNHILGPQVQYQSTL